MSVYARLNQYREGALGNDNGESIELSRLLVFVPLRDMTYFLLPPHAAPRSPYVRCGAEAITMRALDYIYIKLHGHHHETENLLSQLLCFIFNESVCEYLVQRV